VSWKNVSTAVVSNQEFYDEDEQAARPSMPADRERKARANGTS